MMLPEYELKPGIYHVSVTDDDIGFGKREDATACPIARALNRALDIDCAEVDSPHFRIGYLEGDGPLSIDAFVGAFDAGEPVRPFEFDLKLDWREPDE